MFGVSTPTRPPISCTAVDQRVELDGAAGLGVLQHRCAKAAELAGHRDPLFARLRDRATDAGTDLGRLRHAAQDEGTHQRVVGDGVGERAGQRGDRVHRHVAPELVPDVAAHIAARFGLKARAGECRADRIDASRRPAGRLTDDQPLPEAMLDASRCRRRAGQVDDAAEHARERQAGEQSAARVDARERRRGGHGGRHEPPRHAVHRRQQHRRWTDQRRDRLGQRRQRRRLDGDDDELRTCRARARRRSTAIGIANEPSRLSTCRPSRRTAASVAPRASAETSCPARARRAPSRPPTAPRPTMATFIAGLDRNH